MNVVFVMEQPEVPHSGFRFRARTLLLSIAAIAITFTGFCWVADWLDPFNDHRFTTAEWIQTESADSRALMSRDLVNHHLRRGMSKAEVDALLGQPDRILHGGDDRGGNTLGGHETYAYYIGCWILRGFDDTFVYVHFDSSGQVVGAEINGH